MEEPRMVLARWVRAGVRTLVVRNIKGEYGLLFIPKPKWVNWAGAPVWHSTEKRAIASALDDENSERTYRRALARSRYMVPHEAQDYHRTGGRRLGKMNAAMQRWAKETSGPS